MTAAQSLVARVEIRVRGRVQGVGFRPSVWRAARELNLSGEVLNDAEGVLIRVMGGTDLVAAFRDRLRQNPPPLARIETIECRLIDRDIAPGFRIIDSAAGDSHTEVTPDAVVCPACAQEIFDPAQRRYRYAFTNCTHCGPRLSIVRAIPYDRSTTTMAGFTPCDACRAEYDDPTDRRFHAEAIACPACGPRPRLIRNDGAPVAWQRYSRVDAIDAASSLLRAGHIVAVKGLGGYQLACDATNQAAVQRLRAAKHRPSKPFALMASDLDTIRRFCAVSTEEARLLASPEGPIVLLRADGAPLPDCVAPGLTTLGFMLASTPLHMLLLDGMRHPVVMTSGNRSDEPPVFEDADSVERLGQIADFMLVHDRAIALRLDDSVVRVMDGAARVLRRGRGFAPGAIALPPGFATAPDVLAAGGQLKNSFCLTKDGKAILSQHIGDLEDGATFEDYQRNLAHYAGVLDHRPAAVVVDHHPDYLSTKLMRDRSERFGLPTIEVQHHHAHVAACLAENGWPLHAPPVLGIVLDGLGWGEDATIWGGEFLFADYRQARRIGTFKPVAMAGGEAAVRQPWRNLYAHLTAIAPWHELAGAFGDLDLVRRLAGKPIATIEAMIRGGLNSPMASSCGRLFDAVAAAVGLCDGSQSYEGEAATRLEALVQDAWVGRDAPAHAYEFAIGTLPGGCLPAIDPLPMWRALLRDLTQDTPRASIAARFHQGLADAVVKMACHLAGSEQNGRFDTIALSGGCLQNAVLFQGIVQGLRDAGFVTLTQRTVPMNDGGLALGQAAVGAARLMAEPGAFL